MSGSSEALPARELRATFSSSGRMQEAVGKLSLAGFDRADLSLPVEGEGLANASAPADTAEDAQQLRTLGSSTAATIAALAAAGVTVATGGAAAPAVIAALAAGGAIGGATYAVHGSSQAAEQHDRDERAAEGDLILTVHVASQEKRAAAQRILQEAGATNIEAIE